MRDSLSTVLIVFAVFCGLACLGGFFVFYDDMGNDDGNGAIGFVVFAVAGVLGFVSYLGAEHDNPANGGARMDKAKTYCSACGKKRRWGQSCSCGRPASFSE